MPRVTLRSLALLFLRVGNSTFGGGDAITALLQRELVGRHRWLTVDQFGLAQSLAKITPGTGILAFCAAAAWLLRRWAGAVVAVVAASVPSAVIVIVLTAAFTALPGSGRASATLAAVLAAAIGLMWAASWWLVQSEWRPAIRLRTAVLVSGAFLALARWSISPIEVLVAAAVIGFVWAGGGEP